MNRKKSKKTLPFRSRSAAFIKQLDKVQVFFISNIEETCQRGAQGRLVSVSGTFGRQSWSSESQSAAPPPSVLKISNTVALPYIPARTPFAEKRVFWHSILP